MFSVNGRHMSLSWLSVAHLLWCGIFPQHQTLHLNGFWAERHQGAGRAMPCGAAGDTYSVFDGHAGS